MATATAILANANTPVAAIAEPTSQPDAEGEQEQTQEEMARSDEVLQVESSAKVSLDGMMLLSKVV